MEDSLHIWSVAANILHTHKELTMGGPLARGLGETLTIPQHKNQQVTKCYKWGPGLRTDPLTPENYIMRSFMYSSPNIFRITEYELD